MKQLFLLVALVTLPSVLFAGEYIPADGPSVRDQYIVVFKDNMPSVEAREMLLHSLAVKHNGAVKGVFRHALNGGVIQMTQSQAEAFSRLPTVAYVEQDSLVWSTGTQSPVLGGLIESISLIYP